MKSEVLRLTWWYGLYFKRISSFKDSVYVHVCVCVGKYSSIFFFYYILPHIVRWHFLVYFKLISYTIIIL